MTAEACTAFPASRQLLLPANARRDYERSKRALDAGDLDRAQTYGEQAAALLDHIDADRAGTLRADLQRLLASVAEAKGTADDYVYSRANTSVVPPSNIIRQFVTSTPPGDLLNHISVHALEIGYAGH